MEAYHAYLRSAPWCVYLLKYAASGIAFYAGSSKRAKRLSEHIQAAMKGGSDATQRDLHAVIRFQILVLGQKPILEKVFVRISTNREAGADRNLRHPAPEDRQLGQHPLQQELPLARRKLLGPWQE